MRTNAFLPIGIVLLGTVAIATVRGAEKNIFLPLTTPDPAELSDTTACATKAAAITPPHPDIADDVLFTAYHITADQRSLYAVEMIVPASLGGAATRNNLWPHLTVGPWNHSDKMTLDAALTGMVCGEQVTLATAQHALTENWTDAYERYVGPYPTH